MKVIMQNLEEIKIVEGELVVECEFRNDLDVVKEMMKQGYIDELDLLSLISDGKVREYVADWE